MATLEHRAPFQSSFSLRRLWSPVVLASLFLIPQLACSSTDYGNPKLLFTTGQDGTALEGVERFEIERFDSKGHRTKLLDAATLPETLELDRDSQLHQYRVTGYDADQKRILGGRSLTVQSSQIPGETIPLFMARTDRASSPDGEWSRSPGKAPTVALLYGKMLWLVDGGTGNQVDTDAYSIAYYQQLDPPSALASFDCEQVSCELSNALVVGQENAILISPRFALVLNVSIPALNELASPEDLGDWKNVAGGRVLSGAEESAVLIGPSRMESPSSYVVGFDQNLGVSVLDLETERAGAASLFEEGYGLVVVGGSSEGPGVERLVPGDSEFISLDYAPDPVVGAALVPQDGTHLLRVGGLTPDGEPAATVRIDIDCDADCEYEEVDESHPSLITAESFYNSDRHTTLIVGRDGEGRMQAVRYDGAFTPIPLDGDQGRIEATVMELPTEQVVLVGGSVPEGSDSRSNLSMISF